MEIYTEEPNRNFTDSKSFKSKTKTTGDTTADGNTKNIEIAAPLIYLSNFWKTFKIPLTSYEINLTLTWSSTCVITNSTGAGKFEITNTKLYVSIVNL